MPLPLKRHFFWLIPMVLTSVTQGQWRSSLYPTDWTPPEDKAFHAEPFIQDFSHAGYHAGSLPIPWVEGPYFDVTTFGADPSGQADSTAAIQAAIDACEAAGGGVVFLPEGLFSLSIPSNATEALLVENSSVVLRGSGIHQTRLLNTTTLFRLAYP